MKKNSACQFKSVVIGVSSGGVTALKSILGALPPDFPLPVLVATHITPDSDDGLAVLLNTHCIIRVKEADELENLVPGTVYFAPANYHLLVEQGETLAFSVDPPVCYARPSVDVLFESAAEVYGPALIGIILTGAGYDGCKGLLMVKNCGGITIIQDPTDAEADSMPKTALQTHKADYIVRLTEIPSLLMELVQRNS